MTHRSRTNLAGVCALTVGALMFLGPMQRPLDGQHRWRCAHITTEPKCGGRR